MSSHHTAWVAPIGLPSHALRYVVEGDRLICFGDDVLRDVPDGSLVKVSIHEIAGGQELASFGARLTTLPVEDVSMSALAELLDHLPLGRSIEEVCEGLERARTHRRVVALNAQ